jgi:hypothetical protein
MQVEVKIAPDAIDKLQAIKGAMDRLRACDQRLLRERAEELRAEYQTLEDQAIGELVLELLNVRARREEREAQQDAQQDHN